MLGIYLIGCLVVLVISVQYLTYCREIVKVNYYIVIPIVVLITLLSWATFLVIGLLNVLGVE